MLRRLSCLAIALAFAASSVFSSAAWSADSFISGGSEYEPSSDVVLSDDLPVPDVYAAPRRAPGMVKVSAADQAAAESSTTGKLVVPDTLPSSVDGTFEIMSKHYVSSDVAGVKLEQDRWDTVLTSVSPSPLLSPDFLAVFNDFSVDYTPNVSDVDDMVRGLAVFCDYSSGVTPPGYIMTGHAGATGGGNTGRDSWVFTLNYDVSSFSSSAFSLDGLFSFGVLAHGPYWPLWPTFPCSSVDVLVDGQQVLTLSRGSAQTIDFGGYVFSGSSNVSTISFRFHMPFAVFVSDDTQYAGTYTFSFRSLVSRHAANALTISFLDGQDVINAQNNKTKGDINKHEEYESQWTGSMTENFNALGFSDFSWSDSLVSGFSLFSGIFMDIWRALGGATILFTFPLLLGIALLLVGRISRSGGRSGSGKGGGDGG